MGLVFLISNFLIGFNSTKLPKLKSNQFSINGKKMTTYSLTLYGDQSRILQIEKRLLQYISK